MEVLAAAHARLQPRAFLLGRGRGDAGTSPRETGAAVCRSGEGCSPNGSGAQLSKRTNPGELWPICSTPLPVPRALGAGWELLEPQGWAERPGEPGFRDPGFRGGDKQISAPAQHPIQSHGHIPASWGLGTCPCNEGWKPTDVQLFRLEKVLGRPQSPFQCLNGLQKNWRGTLDKGLE